MEQHLFVVEVEPARIALADSTVIEVDAQYSPFQLAIYLFELDAHLLQEAWKAFPQQQYLDSAFLL
jgi:hypothetical protein